VSLAWLMHQPGVTAPIFGANKLPHLADAVAALQVQLNSDELKALSACYKPHPVRGHN